VVPVPAPVLQEAAPDAAPVEGGPEVLEDLDRHIRMAHEIVGPPQELLAIVPADIDEFFVDIEDVAPGIRHGQEEGVLLQQVLHVCDGQILLHGRAPRSGPGGRCAHRPT
jgi:hypothetical protein